MIYYVSSKRDKGSREGANRKPDNQRRIKMGYTYEFRWYGHDDWKRPSNAKVYETWQDANDAGAIYSAKVRVANGCGINADYRVVEVAA